VKEIVYWTQNSVVYSFESGGHSLETLSTVAPPPPWHRILNDLRQLYDENTHELYLYKWIFLLFCLTFSLNIVPRGYLIVWLSTPPTQMSCILKSCWFGTCTRNNLLHDGLGDIKICSSMRNHIYIYIYNLTCHVWSPPLTMQYMHNVSLYHCIYDSHCLTKLNISISNVFGVKYEPGSGVD
jgi:hypothetical protein